MVCIIDSDSISACKYNVVACSNGDVRLAGGATESEGTVEVCSRSVWGVISATGWTDRDAAVVCNQLGYPSGG